LTLLLVTVLSLWVLRPVLANGFLHYDDDLYLAELQRMGSFSWSSLQWMWTSLQPFYLQPIVWMTHLADYQLWGLNPLGHHLTNLLLHGVYVALVGTLVWMLTGKGGDMRPGERLAMSAGVALVCGIHPLQVESVAWVAARNGLLCSVWMVAALCAYVCAVGDGAKTKRGWWWVTMALCAIALLTKPFAVSLPLVMLAVDFFPLQRHMNRSPWRLVGEKWLMIVLCGAAAVGAIAAQPHVEGLGENAIGQRLLVAARGVVFYLWKLAWPAWLSPFYPLSNHMSLWSAEFLVPVLACVGITVTAIWQRKRVPVLLAAWVSHLAILLPVSGLVPTGGQAAANRYAYLPMVPVLIVAGSGMVWIWRRAAVAIRAAICVVVAAWLVFLGWRTRQDIAVWHDDFSLWGTWLSRFPDDPSGEYNMGLTLLRNGRLAEARPFVERAVARSDPHARPLPMARATLGVIYLKTHAYGQAVEQLRQAVGADATLLTARYNLACAYARLGRLAEAYDTLRELISAHPEYATLAARDGELTAVRSDPEYKERFSALIGATKN
jgi:Flp pilus assembly protein TadD